MKSLSSELNFRTKNEAVSWKRPWQCKDASSSLEFKHHHPGHPFIEWSAGESYTNPETDKWTGKAVMDSLTLEDATKLHHWLTKQIETMQRCKDLDTLQKSFDESGFRQDEDEFKRWTLIVNPALYVQQVVGGQAFSIYHDQGGEKPKFIQSNSSLFIALQLCYGLEITLVDEAVGGVQ